VDVEDLIGHKTVQPPGELLIVGGELGDVFHKSCLLC
jgi:hypothetical protein